MVDDLLIARLSAKDVRLRALDLREAAMEARERAERLRAEMRTKRLHGVEKLGP